MILVIRISGMVKKPSDVTETLFRMRLRRKYSAVLLEDTKENIKLISNVRNFVAFGKISDEMLHKLIEKRGQPINKKKIDSKTVVANMSKGFEEAGIKPFFRLHPPRGGVDTKLHFGTRKGVLGNNKEAINNLVEKML